MKKTLAAAALCGMVILGGAANAQNKTICGNEVIQQKIESDPVLKAQFENDWSNYAKNADEALKQYKRSSNKATGLEVLIPVVFHVILTESELNEIGGYNGMMERISTQMEVINEDFNNKNADLTTVPDTFKPLIGNPYMLFEVAKIDPSGKAHYAVDTLIKAPGFTGYPVHDGSAKRTFQGGLDPWDNTKYLNIWIVNLTSQSSGGQVLGYGYSPAYGQKYYSDSKLGGVVLHYLAFGRRTKVTQKFYSGNSDRGRTLSHELGHFFNIWHIWGNTQVGSGNCNDDDGIGDTPRQRDANQNCPNGVKPNCSNESHPGGEMYMNFMDYSGDKCIKMFTEQQVAVMHKEIDNGGISHGLILHPELCFWPTNVSKVEYNNKLDIVPNPSNGKFSVRFFDKYNVLQRITVTNMLGQTVYNEIVTNQAADSYPVDISNMPEGVYSVQLHFDEGMISRKVVIK